VIDELHHGLHDVDQGESSTGLVRLAASMLVPAVNELFENWLEPKKLERNIQQSGYCAGHRLVALITQVEAYLNDPFVKHFVTGEALPTIKNWHDLTPLERQEILDVVARKLGVPGGLVELKERLQLPPVTYWWRLKANDLLRKTNAWIQLGKSPSHSVKPMTHCLHMLSVSWVLSDPCRMDEADSLLAQEKSWCEVITRVCAKCGDGAEPAMLRYVEH
jgi:hypothetical protein